MYDHTSQLVHIEILCILTLSSLHSLKQKCHTSYLVGTSPLFSMFGLKLVKQTMLRTHYGHFFDISLFHMCLFNALRKILLYSQALSNRRVCTCIEMLMSARIYFAVQVCGENILILLSVDFLFHNFQIDILFVQLFSRFLLLLFQSYTVGVSH